jgi:ppGpp synthetase/RelA/SpoT-type nucleotidyltranferase
MKFDDYEKTYVSSYTEFAEVVRSLLEDAIAETEGLPRLQSAQARGKGVTSLKRKLEERGLLASERIESEIKDLAGVRLIFYTNTDVDRFLNSGLIPDTFDIDRQEVRIHHPTDDNDQRRYQAIHYTVSLSGKHTALPKYKKFKGMRCEIQIQTVLNHAWAETHHDMIYKARGSQGFGTDAQQALDKRMKKIMDDYLRPAGYEFQKVQHDYERLMQGKALFDRGAIETLESCDNNNERHEILSTLAEHVIPNYDDIGGVYPEIRRALETAVQAARNTETKPIESPFGNFPGKTSKDVTLAVVGILDTLRYVDVEATFRSLIGIYKGEQDGEVRKKIVDAIKHLAKYHLDVWNQAGPYVQAVLADVMERFSQDDLHMLRPIVLTVWRELLKSDMESTSFSADTLTINNRALPVFEGIKAIRNRAIDGLIALFDGSSTEGEKREVVSALWEATRLPGRANYSNELLQLTLEDTKRITELLTERATGQPYELLEHVEHVMLFDYRRARKFATDEHDKSDCQQSAKHVMEAIITFRDLINTDQQYIRYKTLVGFESVFSFHWENEAFDYSALNEYRKEQVALYVYEVSDETADDWYRLIQRCAATKSNDMATFPVFGEFLSQLSKAKSNFAFALARRDDADVLAFLPVILTGLFESEARDKYAELLEDYLGRNAYLTAIARHCRSVKKDAASTVKKVLDRAIAVDEVIAVSECLIFAIENHDSQGLPLVDNVFVPAIKYLNGKQDARWIRGAWYLPESEKFFYELPSEYADLVLENLLALNRIDHDAESILTPIAMNRPASVWTFFERRVRDRRDREDRYQAIPYQFHDLAQALAKDVDLAITTLRKWYSAGDPMFRFTGGLLLQAVFPAFTDELASSLNQIIARGSDEDYDFASRLLENYHGETPTHEVIKELIERLPENDPRLTRLDICLSNTGGVWGEFGMVAAFRKKKEEIALWLEDSRPKVREFAASYVRSMEQRIASEQRSAEIRKELRMRDYEAESE